MQDCPPGADREYVGGGASPDVVKVGGGNAAYRDRVPCAAVIMDDRAVEPYGINIAGATAPDAVEGLRREGACVKLRPARTVVMKDTACIAYSENIIAGSSPHVHQ